LLRNSRRQHGLSQIELGGDRYSGSYISLLESGRREPTPEVVEFLSRRLGVSPLEWGVRLRHDVDENGQLAPAPAQPATVENLMVAERAWYDRDWLAAAAHAGLAARSAAAAGETDRYWEASYVLAQAKFNNGEFEEAARLADQLSDHETAVKFGVARTQALSLASIAFRANGNLGWAVAYGARAVEAAGDGAVIIRAEALMSLVSALSEIGHVQESSPYLARLEQLLPELASDHSRGLVMWTIGTAALKAGDAARGLEWHARAGELLSPQRDLRLWLRFHRSAANARLELGIVEGVAEMLRISSTGLEVIGNVPDVIELRQSLARLALLEGRPNDAIDLIRSVLDDPVMGLEKTTRGTSELLLAEGLAAVGDGGAAGHFATAAELLERGGRLPEALRALRRAVEIPVEISLTTSLTTQSSP
jgi:transcriptional regulator with XRE-family HTH domain